MKLTTLFMLAITSAITLVGCSDNDDPKNPVAVTGVTLNTSSLSLHKGESETLTATVKPENAEDKTVTWSSSDITCVSVDNTGKVTAIAIGKATVTAEAGQKSATCLITVTGIPVESVTLDKETHEIQGGETVTQKATVQYDLKNHHRHFLKNRCRHSTRRYGFSRCCGENRHYSKSG